MMSGSDDPPFDISFWRVASCDGTSGIDQGEFEKADRPSTLFSTPIKTTPEFPAEKAACQLGLLGAVLPATLNSTISLCMSNLNFQLVLARQHSETLQLCAQNWQMMQRNIASLSKEISDLSAEAALHNFHLPPPPSENISRTPTKKQASH